MTETWWPDRGRDFKGNRGVVGRFVRQVLRDQDASLRTRGAETRDYVLAELKIQGSNDVVAHEVKPDNIEFWKKRLPEAWEAFSTAEPAAIEGTPLKELPLLGADRAVLLGQHGIYTIEQLRDAPAHVLARFGIGARDLQKAAVAYLATQGGEAPETAASAPAKVRRKPGPKPGTRRAKAAEVEGATAQ